MSYQTFMPFCMRINMYQEVNLVGSTWILGCLTVGQYVTKLEMCQVQSIIEADGTSITSSWIIFCGTSSSFVACFLEIRLWAFVVLYTEMPNVKILLSCVPILDKDFILLFSPPAKWNIFLSKVLNLTICWFSSDNKFCLICKWRGVGMEHS